MTDPARPRALIISHEDTSGGGFIETSLVERGVNVTVHVVVPDRDRPDQPSPYPDHRGFDMVISMGSAWSVYDHDTIGAWIHEELGILRAAHEARTPVLGICFGGQAVAAALGGSVQPATETEMGWFEIQAVGDELPIPAGPWLEWHHDEFAPPPSATLMAETDVSPQLFRLGRSVGTQFHPEISVELMSAWLQDAPAEYLAEHGTTAEEMLGGVVEHEDANRRNCAQLVDWFLDEVVGLAVADGVAP